MAKKLEYNTDYLFNYDVKDSVNSVIDEVDGLVSSVSGLIDEKWLLNNGVTFYQKERFFTGATITTDVAQLSGLSKLYRYVEFDNAKLFRVSNNIGLVDFFGSVKLKTTTESSGAGNIADINGQGATQSYASYSIRTAATKVSFRISQSTRCNLMVNGKLTSILGYTTPSNSGSPSYVNVEFATGDEVREITLIFPYSGAASFSGVYVTATDKLFKPKAKIKACAIGDSFSVGTSNQDPAVSWPCALMQAFDLDINLSGRGSTGFLAKSNTLNYLERISDAVQAQSDVVFLASSINDSQLDQSLVAANVLSCISYLRANLPLNVKIIVIGSFGINSTTNVNGEQTVKDAVNSLDDNNLYFIPVLTSDNPPVTGTGTVSSPTGDGNADKCMASDGVHYTALGHMVASAFVVEKIKELL